MTVGELIRHLSDHPKDCEVVVAIATERDPIRPRSVVRRYVHSVEAEMFRGRMRWVNADIDATPVVAIEDF